MIFLHELGKISTAEKFNKDIYRILNQKVVLLKVIIKLREAKNMIMTALQKFKSASMLSVIYSMRKCHRAKLLPKEKWFTF